MQAVVPAAGAGTRLRPLTDDRPKGLIEVAGDPLLAHGFETLADLGATELIVVVGYRGEQITAHFGDSYAGVPITYVKQDDPTGLAHAVLRAESHVTGSFMVMNGDNVFRADLSTAVARHEHTGPDATLVVESVTPAAARDTGVVELAAGEPAGLVEKPADPPSTLVTTGFFVFSPAIFPACRLVTPSDRGEYELTDAIDLLLAADRPVELVRLDGWRRNVNTPEDRDAVASRLGE